MTHDNLTTAIALVLDETGSMTPTVTDTIGAVNGYLDSLGDDTPDALVSVMTFSDVWQAEPTFRVHASAVRPSEVPRLTTENYRPRGNTPLYDAIGKAIVETEKIEADRYILVVMTDGEENASQEYTLTTVKQLIEKKQGENWTVVYLGANQDAWQVGARLGTSSAMTYAQTAKGMRATSKSLANATAALTASRKLKSADFFGEAGQTAADYSGENEDDIQPEEPSLWGNQ